MGIELSQRYINLNPVRLFVQQPPEKGMGSRGFFKYASAYNRGRQLSHRKTKLNQIRQEDFASLFVTKIHITQNQHKN